MWLRKILEDLQVKQVQSTPLMIDNTSAIKLAKNPKFHDRTKHINTKYHLIRHHVEAKTIHLRHCSTNEQIVDIFTKALGREKLERFRMMLGLTNIPSEQSSGDELNNHSLLYITMSYLWNIHESVFLSFSAKSGVTSSLTGSVDSSLARSLAPKLEWRKEAGTKGNLVLAPSRARKIPLNDH